MYLMLLLMMTIVNYQSVTINYYKLKTSLLFVVFFQLL